MLARRPKLSLMGADISPAETSSTASYTRSLAKDFALRAVLRVGDYEVGATFCPRLCGHPGIRY
ncbi:MAG: hypothetical protein M3Y12_05385 [Bacteroidota bacterium]|nr:hypothetical protein [Bacteroidota bacterium]